MTLETGASPEVAPEDLRDNTPEIIRQRVLDQSHILSLPSEEKFDQVTRLAIRLFNVEFAALTLKNGNRLSFQSRVSADPFDVSTGEFLFDFANRQTDVLTVADALSDPRFRDNPLVTGGPRIRFYAGYPLKGPSGERLGAFCLFDSTPRILTDFEKHVLRELTNWVQLEIMAAQDYDRAAEVQRGLLPKRLVTLPGYEVTGACVPAQAVGGDFYDWYPVTEGAAFTLADVMGKGIGAAIIAATVRAVLRSGSRNTAEVSLVLASASETLESDLAEAGTFVTLFHARLDTETGVMRYIDAGHGLTLVVHADGRTVRLATTDFPLGAGIIQPWEVQSVTLNRGDTVIAVSDGVLDIFDGTLASLDEVAKVVRASVSAQAVVDTLVAIAAGASAPDDVSMLVVRRSE